MGVFSRSWGLTKSTWNVMKEDKEIFAFPVVAIVLSIIFMVLFVMFAISLGIISLIGGISMVITGYFLLFVLYLFLALISTFFSVCVVYTASMRFSGKNATFGQSIGFASRRIGKIFLWAIVSATVGLILKILENIAEKAKGVGKIALEIFNWILGALWGIATIFVLQGIVYKDLGPFASIKESVITLKKTWGESLIKYLGLGIAEFLFILIGAVIGVPLIILSVSSGSIGLLLTIIGLLMAYVVAIVIFFNIADDVFNTALYVYANTGRVPAGYSKEQMKEAFRPQAKKSFSPIE